MYELKTSSADLSKLSTVVGNDVAKNNLQNQLVTKFSFIDAKIPFTRGLVNKTKHTLDKQGFEKKMEDVDKEIHNLADCSKRLTTRQKLPRRKTKYLNMIIWLQQLLQTQRQKISST